MSSYHLALTFSNGFAKVTANMARSSVCALVSGGVESCALIATLLRGGAVVYPVYVAQRLRWETAEQRHLRRWLRQMRQQRLQPLTVYHVPLTGLYKDHWSVKGVVPSARSADRAVYLPGRNIWLATAGALAAQARRSHRVALGLLGSNPFGDATAAFLRQFGRALSSALGWRIVLESPLRRSAKHQLIRRAPRLPWPLTFSCLRPLGGRHCGRCNKCAERQHAFRRAGAIDATRYAS